MSKYQFQESQFYVARLEDIDDGNKSVHYFCVEGEATPLYEVTRIIDDQYRSMGLTLVSIEYFGGGEFVFTPQSQSKYGRMITVLGKRADTQEYIVRKGYNVLDLAADWSAAKQAKWLEDAFRRGDDFLLVSRVGGGQYQQEVISLGHLLEGAANVKK